jgi:hypothetical protein
VLFFITEKGLTATENTFAHLFITPIRLPDILTINRKNLQNLLNSSLRAALSGLAKLQHARQKSTYNLLFSRFIHQTRTSKRTSSPLEPIERLFDPFNILQTKLCLYNLHIAERIHVALYVNHLRVIESTDDLEDPIDGTNMR